MNQQFSDLPESVRDSLSIILAKNPSELIQYEIDLLKSRRDYLNAEQLTKFAQHLGGLPKAQAGKKNNKPAGQPAGTRYKVPANDPGQQPAAPESPIDPAAEAQKQAEADAAAHQELVTEAESLNIVMEGNESSEQLAEAIADAKEEDLAKATELGIDVTGMSAVDVMNAVAEKENAAPANPDTTETPETAEGVVGTEEVTNGQSEDENPYGGSNADPDTQA